MSTIISYKAKPDVDIIMLEVVDYYNHNDQSDFVDLMGLFRIISETEENLITPYSITFYLNLN